MTRIGTKGSRSRSTGMRWRRPTSSASRALRGATPDSRSRPNGTTITIGKGRYYVDGLLCENETDLEYDAQNAGDLPGASVGSVLEALKKAQTPFAIAYLDVWKRQITSLEDPLIREVALGGADTATRVRVVWQVKILPVACGRRCGPAGAASEAHEAPGPGGRSEERGRAAEQAAHQRQEEARCHAADGS